MKFIFAGRLTKAAEARGNGLVIVNVAKNVYNASTKSEESHFFRMKAFGGTGERLARLDKGSYIIVSGRIRNNNYEDQNGVKHYGDDYVINEIIDLPIRKLIDSDASAQDAADAASPAPQAPQAPAADDGFGPVDPDDPNLPWNQ